MPNQSSNLTALRAGNHAANVYVSVMDGTSVLEGELTADADAASELNLTYTLTAGDAADVYPGMRVMILDVSGAPKGMTSVRFAGTVSSSNLPIREVSWGEIQLVTGDTFIVYDDFLPTDKLVAADESFAPDHITYTDQTSNPPPIPTSGGHYVYWLPASGSIAIPFVGSSSYTIDPDSSGTVTHSWFCASGTWDSDTDDNPTLTLTAAGKYLIIHTITDDTNTKTEVQFIRVRIHDANDPPYECSDVSVDGDDTAGFSATFKLFENATLSDIPDGIMVVVWAQEFIDGTEAVYGNIIPSRSHILCTGYLQRDRGSGSDDRGNELEFDVISPLARYMALPGFSKAITRASSPTDWTQIKGMTIKRAITHLFRNYTNIHQLHDVVFSDFDDADYPKLYLQKANIWEQIKELADSRGGRITADMAGRIEIQEKIELSSLLERTALPTITTVGGLDTFSYDVTREHIPVLETYRMRGFKAAAEEADTATYLVRFPSSPGRGANSPTTEKAIFDDLSHAFQQVALRGALENRVFFTSDGAQYHAPDAQFTFPGSYAHLFQFYREMFYIAVGYGSALRGAELGVAFRWIPKAVSISFTDGTFEVSLTARAETNAPEFAGVEDPITAGTVTITEPGFNYPPPTYDPSSDFLLGSNTYDIGFISDDGYLYLGDTRPTSPVWSRVALAGLGVSGTPVMPIIDAFNFANGVLVTSTHAYSFANIGSSSRAFSNSYALRYTTIYRNLQSERGVSGFFVCASHQDDQRVDLDYTTNGGVGWTRVTDIGGDWPGTSGDNIYPGCYVFAGTAGKVLFGALSGTGTTTTGRIKVSTDYGATNSDFDANTTIGFISDIHCPFQNEAVTYSGGIISAGYSDYRLYKTVAGTRSDVSPSDGSEYYGPTSQFGVKTCDVDANSLLLAGQNRDTGTIKFGVWLSRNAGSSWTNLVSAATGVNYRSVLFAGDSPNTAWFWGAAGAIAVCRNLNATTPTIKDLSGNLSSFTSPSVGRILSIFGV